MMPGLAIIDSRYAWMGLIPAAVIIIALIVNVSSMRGRDTNFKCAFSANVLFITLLIECAAGMVGVFGGGTDTGFFWTVLGCAALHVVAGSIAVRGLWEIRTHPKWAHGRQRAVWGFWLNVLMLLVLSAWFYLQVNQWLRNRILG
jgi:hypothetical protein